MFCPHCNSDRLRKYGFRDKADGTKTQRWECRDCERRCTHLLDELGDDKVPMRSDVPKVSRYIVTTAQNATPVDKNFWQSIIKCAEHYSAEIIVIPSRYKNPTSQWTTDLNDHEWWDAPVLPFLVKGNIALHKALMIVNTKVQFTASNPLASMETLTGDKSGIVGHPRVAQKSVATPQNKHPKMMYTTGACTVENYTDTKAGHIGRFNHSFGALLVECADDRFHVRQLSAMKNGSFCDLNMEFTPDGCATAKRPLGLVMGDTHWCKIDPKVKAATFDRGGMIDFLRPRNLFWHDLLDQYARNHHHKNNWIVDYKKNRTGQDNLTQEIHDTLDGLINSTPSDCNSLVVSSNHDRALARWLLEANFKTDPINARLYLKLSAMMIDYLEKNDFKGIDPFILYAREYVQNSDKKIVFLEGDESFMLNGVEHCLHGDIGTNGSRGTTRNLSRIGVKVTKGHSHTAEIIDGCYSVGKSTGKLEYEAGPSSHSNTHCVQYYNGKRALITIINGKWKI